MGAIMVQGSRKRERGGRGIVLVLATALLAVLAATPWASAQTYKALHDFSGSDGSEPWYGNLIEDKAGNLYGTTLAGGSSGCGVVFKLDIKTGAESTLYNFACGADGSGPQGGLALSGHTLYGATYGGGSGYGVVFEVNIKAKTEKVLYTFSGGADGANPWGTPILDKAGNIYGTTWGGGSSGDGVVFVVVPKTKKEKVLHSFSGSDGVNLLSGVTLDKTEKVLYGSTWLGGSGSNGVVFSLTIKSGAYTVLYNFTGGADGGGPSGPLLVGTGSKLYGGTQHGGSDYGVVFEVNIKAKTEKVLYTFSGGTDGGTPCGGVAQDKAGNLFGNTFGGGANGEGTIFELSKSGTETVLHSFDGSDGDGSLDGLIGDSKGNFYGTTYQGGSGSDGVVFSIHP